MNFNCGYRNWSNFARLCDNNGNRISHDNNFL